MANSDMFGKEEFSRILRETRSQRGYTQGAFAKEISVQPTTYNGYEQGRYLPPYDILYNMARALGVSPDYLLGFKRELSLADMASTLMALSFDKNVRIWRNKAPDKNDNQGKQIIHITISGGDLRQIMSEFIEFSQDRKEPEKGLQDFKDRLNEMDREKAWSFKNEHLWQEFINKMLYYRGESTDLTESELKKFIYGGFDDGEPQTKDEQEGGEIL